MPSSIRACAVSYGAPTRFHSSRARWRQRVAPSASPSASLIRPEARWTVASKAGARRPPILYESTMLSSSVGRCAGGLQVAGRDRDLDLRGQTRKTPERLVEVLEAARDPRHRPVDLALAEPKQREARLRVAPELVRLGVGLLRGGEVAEAAADLADLVVPARGDPALEVVQLLAGRHRLLLRLGQVAAKPHDLRPVDAAGAREAGDVEPVAPAVRRLGPLGRAPVVAEVLARADRHAVDEPGRVGPQLAADRGRASPRRAGRGRARSRRSSRAPAPCRRAPASACRGRRSGNRARRRGRSSTIASRQIARREHRVDRPREREVAVLGGLRLVRRAGARRSRTSRARPRTRRGRSDPRRA